MNKGAIHIGHRQRLKDKVKNNGLKSLSTHEVLELLLTYSIPYKDTNQLAHDLINTYGSLEGVLKAGREELLTHVGVGEETALFLSILNQFITEIYQPNKELPIVLNNVNSCVRFFLNKMGIEENEKSYLVLTDEKDRFIKVINLSNGSTFKTYFNREDLSKYVATTKCKNIIIFHTHPNGKVNPSVEDINSTKAIVGMCKLLGVNFVDHIILNSCEYFSFRTSGILMELKVEVDKKINEIVPKDLINTNQKDKKG